MKPIFLLVIFTLFFIFSGNCQDTIYLKNPSFEGLSGAAQVPQQWYDCGFPKESAPDTHPSGEFSVDHYPFDGETYLGLVVRDIDTWERVTQQLKKPLIADQCYEFDIALCRSKTYMSRSKLTGQSANYTTPCKLKIWAGSDRCQRTELLAESELVKNYDWEIYHFQFKPQKEHQYIILEAFYKTPVLFPYNGNLLIDNASPIFPVECNSSMNYDTPPIAVGNEMEMEELIDIFYFNSTLNQSQQEQVIQAISSFINDNPYIVTDIYIEEKTKKTAKNQKKYLTQELDKLNVNKFHYRITLLKN